METMSQIKNIRKNKENNKRVTIKKTLTVGVLATTIALTGVVIPSSGIFGFNSSQVQAATVVAGDYSYTDNADGSVTVTGYTGTSKSVVIPSVLDGKNVTVIGDMAFDRLNLTSVTIPEGVTKIGDEAFDNNLLTDVVIPEGVTEIGSHAFNGSGLNSNGVIYEGNDIASVSLPSTLKVIHEGAFYMNELTDVVIPEGVTLIGGGSAYGQAGAFEYNSIADLTIPSTVTEIGDSAFYNNNISDLTLPDGLVSIGEQAFRSNELTSLVIPNSVTTIGDGAFWGGTGNKITSVVLSENLTHIGNDAFNGNKLTELTIPENVTEIGNNAFLNNQLSSVTIPSKVTSIGSEAFADNSLTDVMVLGTVTEMGSGAFKNNELSSAFGLDNLSVINDELFLGNNLTEVTIPEHIESVGSKAFGSNSISEVTIEGATTKIESDAFSGNQATASNLVVFAPNPSVAKTYASSSGYTVLDYVAPAEPVEPEPTEPEPTEPAPTEPEPIEPTEPGDPTTSKGSADGLVQENEISANIVSGGLQLGSVVMEGFGDIVLTSKPAVHYSSISNPINIKDLRGTQEGWELTVSATPFKNGTDTLPAGSLTLGNIASIKAIDATSEQMPTKALIDTPIIDDGAVLVANADVGQGAGEYDITFDENALGLTVDPTTAKNKEYTSAVTWTLASTPTSN